LEAYRKAFREATRTPGNKRNKELSDKFRLDLFSKHRSGKVAEAAKILSSQDIFKRSYTRKGWSGDYMPIDAGRYPVVPSKFGPDKFTSSILGDINTIEKRGQNLFADAVSQEYSSRYMAKYSKKTGGLMGPQYEPMSPSAKRNILLDYNRDIKTYALNRGFTNPGEAKKAFDTEFRQSYRAMIARNRSRGGLTSFMRKVMSPVDQLVNKVVAPVVKTVSKTVAAIPTAVADTTSAVAKPVAKGLVKPAGQAASSVIRPIMEPVGDVAHATVGPVAEGLGKAFSEATQTAASVTGGVAKPVLKEVVGPSMEAIAKGVVAPVGERITKVAEDLREEFGENLQKISSKITEDIIPNEFSDVWKKINSLDDIKYQIGSKLQKVIDVIPGLGGGGLLASRRDVRKAEEAAAAARKAQEEAMMSEWDRKLKDMDDLWQSQSAKLASDMEGMFAAQEASAKRATLKSERAMMSSRISGIRSMRDLKQTKLDTALGLSGASGESGMGTLARASAQITGRRSGKRAKFSGAAIPTLRVGSEYRPM
jgi:hypothetical protein